MPPTLITLPRLAVASVLALAALAALAIVSPFFHNWTEFRYMWLPRYPPAEPASSADLSVWTTYSRGAPPPIDPIVGRAWSFGYEEWAVSSRVLPGVVYRYRSGWPMVAFEGGAYWTSPSPSRPLESRGIVYSTLNGRGVMSVALGPRWAGLTVDLLLLSTLILVLVRVVELLRQRARRRRGCCAACGYRLHDNDASCCAECGLRRDASPWRIQFRVV